MKINGPAYVIDLVRPQGVQNDKAAEQVARTSGPAKVRSLDRVEISARGRELMKLSRELDAMPDVRLDRVALAKQNLQQGGYRVEPTVLAQKMMDAFERNRG